MSLRGVACRRGQRLLFTGLDLRLAAGEAAVVIGPNGTGKSSLLRIAANLLPPVEGTVKRTGRCALLAEQAALDPERTLAQALGFWATIDGASRSAVGHALDRLDLAHLAAVPVAYLSTGQRRRAGLARIWQGGAAIWLLDEPASGLDDASVAVLEDVIAAHRSGGGIAVVATHQPLDLPGAHILKLGP